MLHGAGHAPQAVQPADVQVVEEQIGARPVHAGVVWRPRLLHADRIAAFLLGGNVDLDFPPAHAGRYAEAAIPEY